MPATEANDGLELTAGLEADQVEHTFTSAIDELVIEGITFETCDFEGLTADGVKFRTATSMTARSSTAP